MHNNRPEKPFLVEKERATQGSVWKYKSGVDEKKKNTGDEKGFTS